MTHVKRIFIIAITLCTVSRASRAQQLRIQSGAIVGVTEGDVTVYRGIPYAAAPVGPLRWRPPQSAPHCRSDRAHSASKGMARRLPRYTSGFPARHA